MANPPSRDALRAELEQRGLPPAYIERLLGELDDHYTDLLEERNSSMGAARKLDFEANGLQRQLGEPTQLAIFAAEQYRGRSFWGRHPFVTFVLGPLPLFIATWMFYLASVLIPMYCLGTLGERMGWWRQSEVAAASADYLVTQAIVLTCFTWGILVLPPLGAALILCRAYRRNALGWQWPVVGCAMLATLVAAFHVSWTLKMGTGPTEHGLLFFDIIQPFEPGLILQFSVKFGLAFGIGLLLVKRSQQKFKLAM